jgi:hypothetical protein
MFCGTAMAVTDAVPEAAQQADLQQSEQAGEIIGAADEAIFNAENIEIFEDKENYLLMKAQEFSESGQFDDVKEIAAYILAKLNSTSEEAQEYLTIADKKIGAQELLTGAVDEQHE